MRGFVSLSCTDHVAVKEEPVSENQLKDITVSCTVFVIASTGGLINKEGWQSVIVTIVP